MCSVGEPTALVRMEASVVLLRMSNLAEITRGGRLGDALTTVPVSHTLLGLSRVALQMMSDNLEECIFILFECDYTCSFYNHSMSTIEIACTIRH